MVHQGGRAAVTDGKTISAGIPMHHNSGPVQEHYFQPKPVGKNHKSSMEHGLKPSKDALQLLVDASERGVSIDGGKCYKEQRKDTVSNLGTGLGPAEHAKVWQSGPVQFAQNVFVPPQDGRKRFVTRDKSKNVGGPEMFMEALSQLESNMSPSNKAKVWESGQYTGQRGHSFAPPVAANQPRSTSLNLERSSRNHVRSNIEVGPAGMFPQSEADVWTLGHMNTAGPSEARFVHPVEASRYVPRSHSSMETKMNFKPAVRNRAVPRKMSPSSADEDVWTTSYDTTFSPIHERAPVAKKGQKKTAQKNQITFTWKRKPRLTPKNSSGPHEKRQFR